MGTIVDKYFDLSKYQSDKMTKLIDVYSFWNQQVNLISRKDFQYFYERHVLHSLSICKVFSFTTSTRIMDLGTGGGFPGIPLAIMFPDVNFHLVDSITKKTQVLLKIIHELELNNVIVENSRAENIDNQFDFIVSRAVANLDKLIDWTQNKICNNQKNDFQNGLICLKGGDLTEEIKAISSSILEHQISDFFEEEFFLEKKILYLPNKRVGN